MSLKLNNLLYVDDETQAYAILDGASVQDLLPQLTKYKPENCCLFAGRLDPEVEQTAPYLVRLDPDDDFSQWVFDKGWGQHWGIFAILPASLPFKSVRKHLRTFLRVRSPEGEPLLFRYYDPRVMRVFLPSCSAEEKEQLFGPVVAYIMEDEADEVIQFRRGGD